MVWIVLILYLIHIVMTAVGPLMAVYSPGKQTGRGGSALLSLLGMLGGSVLFGMWLKAMGSSTYALLGLEAANAWAIFSWITFAAGIVFVVLGFKKSARYRRLSNT